MNEVDPARHGSRIRPGQPGGAEGLTLCATYERRLDGSVERLLENALDWEHLPWLHSTSFTSIRKLEAGNWGWRARVGLPGNPAPQEILLELLLDHEKREWVSRVLEGPGAGNEIWSRTDPVDDRSCDVFVEFHLANVRPQEAEAYGKAYRRLYARLYDEDESMMAGRQAMLDLLKSNPKRSGEPVELGMKDELVAKLPLQFEFGRRPFRLVEFGGKLVAHSTICPHFLGPLELCEVDAGGIVTCPWHGCLFDVSSGKSADQYHYCLETPPRIVIDPATGRVTACPPHPTAQIPNPAAP